MSGILFPVCKLKMHEGLAQVTQQGCGSLQNEKTREWQNRACKLQGQVKLVIIKKIMYGQRRDNTMKVKLPV